ncbi:MAG: metal-dependent transcriptional regulator [Nitrososphaeria archaeon]
MPADSAPKGKRKEDYLRTVYELQRSLGSVRMRDVSRALGVSMPSALEELRGLEREGLIRYSRGSVRLTEDAERLAERIDRRRRTLEEFFEVILGADPEEAERMACYLEHLISDELLGRMECILRFAASHGQELQELTRGHCGGDPARSAKIGRARPRTREAPHNWWRAGGGRLGSPRHRSVQRCAVRGGRDGRRRRPR